MVAPIKIGRLNILKVLFHIDQSVNWKMTVTNVINMLDYGKSENIPFTIEIVANGEAVMELSNRASSENSIGERLKAIAELGVIIVACNNALKAHKVDAADLHTFITIVPAGVVEIAARQSEGYAYIKP